MSNHLSNIPGKQDQQQFLEKLQEFHQARGFVYLFQFANKEWIRKNSVMQKNYTCRHFSALDTLPYHFTESFVRTISVHLNERPKFYS